MATKVLLNAEFDWNSVDMSDHVKSVTLNYLSEPQDDTAMGDTTRSRQGGLLDWSAELELYADEAASEPSRQLFADMGTTATFSVLGAASATSTVNPVYTGTALLVNTQPVAGEVGQMQMTRASFVAAGTLSRTTS